MAYKRKVYHLINCLIEDEREKFDRFLTFELAGKRKEINLLYHLLCKTNDEKQIWSELFPDKPHNDAYLRRLMHDLGSYLEDFLAYQSFRKRQYGRDLHLVYEINQKREAQAIFLRTIRKIHKQLEGQEYRDAVFFRMKYDLAMQEKQFLIKHNLTGKASVPNVSFFFTEWFLQEILLLALVNVDKLHGDNEDFSSNQLMIDMLKFLLVQPDDHFKEPVTIIYLQVLKLLMNQTENIEHIISLIKTHDHSLDINYLRNTYMLLLNFYTKKVNETGKTKYLETLYQLHQWAMEKKIVFVDGYLAKGSFKNFVTLGLKLHKYDEIESYINKYIKHLSIQEQIDALDYNLGQLYFAKKKFPQALKKFNKQFKDASYELATRLYALQSLYEMGDRKELGKPIQNFKRYLKRQKNLRPTTRKALINHLTLFAKLIKANTWDDYEDLEHEIEATQPINNPAWLLEKCKR